MVQRSGLTKPEGSSPFAPSGPATPDRTEQWREREAALIDALVGVSDGNAARILGKGYWPFLWSGEKEMPPRFTDQQREEQTKAPREAVQRWLRVHGRQLRWRLELAGDWRLGDTENRILRSEVRDKITKWGDRNRKASNWLRKLAEQPANAARRKRALEILGEIHGEDDLPAIERSLSDPAEAWTNYALVAEETECWLKERDANGGVNLAAREVANLVANFFDEARIAAMGAEDLATAGGLHVRYARSNDGTQPANQFCRTVQNALVAVGLPKESWRRAALCQSARHPTKDT